MEIVVDDSTPTIQNVSVLDPPVKIKPQKDKTPYFKTLVVEYFNTFVEPDVIEDQIGVEDVYLASYYETLQHCTGVFHTGITDGLLYECTYNGDTRDTTLNVYNQISSTTHGARQMT